MSNFTKYASGAKSPDSRNLGDEWANWDGRDGGTIHEGKGLFAATALLVLLGAGAGLALLIYLISPRLTQWASWLPTFAWVATGAAIVFALIWYALFVTTFRTERNCLPARNWTRPLFDLIFAGVFRVGEMLGITRDRMGHSFVRISNALSRSAKKPGRDETLLLLLPRCLTKELIKEITALKERYPIHVHIVSGGELARKKVRELMPTAVIGVACERDLVSGIRDVGEKLSVIGIPNARPEGPCVNTTIDMNTLIEAIEFYVGKPKAMVS